MRVRLHCKNHIAGVVSTNYVHIDERWTLGYSEGRWILLSVDGDPLAAPLLTAPLVPTPASDTERLHEESLAELAHDRLRGDDVPLSDLVAADERPDLALLDLSVVDGRFLPALIGAELAHLLEVWEEAASGSDEPLCDRARLGREKHCSGLGTADA